MDLLFKFIVFFKAFELVVSLIFGAIILFIIGFAAFDCFIIQAIRERRRNKCN